MIFADTIEQRDYQIRVIDKTIGAVRDGHRNILIESPTGSGKTLMAHLIARRLHAEYGWTTGWTAMRRHLLVQAREENERMIRFDGIRYFSMFDKAPPSGIDILIEDEGHHSASETATELYKTLNPKLHIGLTATPFRTDRMKLCFSRVIKDAGIRSLMDQGYLSPYYQYLFHDDWSPENVANRYLADRELWGKTVIYFLTEVECQACATLIREGGVRSEVVTGSTNQEMQIESFNEGDTEVLLNMVVLTEGFDSPILRTVFVRPGSKGPTIQMSGRAFRRYPGKTHANIVQNAASHWPFTRIASAERKFIAYPGCGWEDRQRNERIDIAQKAAIQSIARTQVDLPPLLKKYQLRKDMTQQLSD